jgi:hypothetical protein
MTDAERHALANLVFLCPTHHAEIDADTDRWTVDRLSELKNEHEERMFCTAHGGPGVATEVPHARLHQPAALDRARASGRRPYRTVLADPDLAVPVSR